MATQAGEEGNNPKNDILTSSREASSASVESSLTWCLAQLSKSSVSGPNPTDSAESSRETYKRLKAGQWKALVAIRTRHIKGGTSRILRYQAQGGLPPLLEILRRPNSSKKVLDLALSILANCCTERATRAEVRKLGGISIVVEVLRRHISVETVENRAARALGNLAMDPEGSAQVHCAGGISLLLLCLSASKSSPTPSSPSASSPTPEPCSLKLERAQSAARALLYLSDTPSNRLSILSQGALPTLALFIAPEYPAGLRRASLRALHELTKGCGTECAKEVSLSGALAHLSVLASGEGEKPLEELALKTLANLCSQGCLRPMVGSLGVIPKFAEEVKKDPIRSGVFLKALCLCCKEAVNRAKVKETGGLEVLVSFLAGHGNHPLTRLAILACVDFVYDEAALEQLQELGLVPLLIARLVQLARGEEPSAGKMDAGLSSGSQCAELMTSCFDSFDFPPPEGSRREEVGKEQGSSSFLSLRSWLVSEGLISSEGELMESPCGTDGDFGTSHPSYSPSSSSSSSPSSIYSSSSSSSSSFSPYNPLPDVLAPALLKNLSSPSARPKPCSRLSIPSSSTLHKTTPPPPSPLLPSCTSTLNSKPLLSPISPLKLSSPTRKRPRTSSSSSSSSTSSRSSMVPLDAPPAVAKTPVYQHPYHPEPWTPESPILLLLSRFSHAMDPSGVLVNAGVLSGLFFYLTHHQDPSGRCFRMLGRLSCNPNCLQALVRTGAVALIRHRLCLGEKEGGTKRKTQSDRVQTKIRQLGQGLLSNIRVQSETGFGSGVLSHIGLSGSESDKLFCVLTLPLITSNRVLLKKLLLDNGALIFALELIESLNDGSIEKGQSDKCRMVLSAWVCPPEQASTARLQSLYASLLIGCLSSLMANSKNIWAPVSPIKSAVTVKESGCPCQYQTSNHDLTFLLDDGTLLAARQGAIAGEEKDEEGEVGSEYFRALLRGRFREAQSAVGDAICIREVSKGMLLPVLHYLHGCRIPGVERKTLEENGECPVLASLASSGLLGYGDFQKSPLVQVMMGASRFLVPGLQKAAEDLCMSLICSIASSVSGSLAQATTSSDGLQNSNRPERWSSCGDHASLLCKTNVCKSTNSQLVGPESGSKCFKADTEKTEQLPGVTSSSSSPSSDEDVEGSALLWLLPQAYSFSQLYSYARLGRTCFSVLLQPHEAQRLPVGLSADILMAMAKEADNTKGLCQDLLSLTSAALN